jgi:hypothetical protein
MPKFLGFRLSPHLVIHRDGQLSVHVKRGRKYRWEHNCEEISGRQFKHLYPEEQVRLRKLEERLGRKLVMPYEVGPDGVTIVWEAKKKSGSCHSVIRRARAARPRL